MTITRAMLEHTNKVQAEVIAALEAQYIDAGESCKAQLAAKDQEIAALKAEAERERADADAAIRRLHAAEEREKRLGEALAASDCGFCCTGVGECVCEMRQAAFLSSPAADEEPERL